MKRKLKFLRLLLTAAISLPLLFSSSGIARASSDDIYLIIKLPGGATIAGDSTQLGRQNQIQILTYSLAGQLPGSAGISANSRSAVRVIFNDFHITKEMDSSSTKLWESFAKGTLFSSVIIEETKPGAVAGVNGTYARYTLTNVSISSISVAVNEQDSPYEMITFAYAGITIEFYKLNQVGNFLPAGRFGWDIARNQQL